MKRRRKAIGLLHATLVIAGTGGATAGFFASWSYLARTRVGAVLDGPRVSAAASMALMRSRVTPAALAAAGLTDLETTALLGRAADWWAEHGTACAAACASADAAGVTLDALERTARSGMATEGELASLASAAGAYASARASHAESMSSLWEAATTGLESGKAARLRTMCEHLNAGRRLPIAYLAAARSEADGVALRDAIAEVASGGAGADAVAQSIVTAADGNSEVSAAKANLANRLAEVASAWNAALDGT